MLNAYKTSLTGLSPFLFSTPRIRCFFFRTKWCYSAQQSHNPTNANPCVPWLTPPPPPTCSFFAAHWHSGFLQVNELQLKYLNIPTPSSRNLSISRLRSLRGEVGSYGGKGAELEKTSQYERCATCWMGSLSERRRTNSAKAMLWGTVFHFHWAVQHWAKPEILDGNGQHILI